ncbi:MAG UNVERIFIED_CONTAM: hypothetical protein LVR18_11455 [Planctomycetaceae bacterium]
MSFYPLQWTICVLAFFAGTVSAAAQTSRELYFPSTDSTWESVPPNRWAGTWRLWRTSAGSWRIQMANRS